MQNNEQIPLVIYFFLLTFIHISNYSLFFFLQCWPLSYQNETPEKAFLKNINSNCFLSLVSKEDSLYIFRSLILSTYKHIGKKHQIYFSIFWPKYDVVQIIYWKTVLFYRISNFICGLLHEYYIFFLHQREITFDNKEEKGNGERESKLWKMFADYFTVATCYKVWIFP